MASSWRTDYLSPRALADGGTPGPVLGRVVIEGEQLVLVVGDLRGRLGELGPVGTLEGLHRGLVAFAILHDRDEDGTCEPLAHI